MKELYKDVFKIGTDYKTTFKLEVDKLVELDIPVEEKNRIVEEITEAYIEQTGEKPDSYELTRLATWIVEDKSKHSNKVAKTEYPVLSVHQITRRNRMEFPSKHISELSNSAKHKMNGKRKPKGFKVFGEYEGGY